MPAQRAILFDIESAGKDHTQPHRVTGADGRLKFIHDSAETQKNIAVLIDTAAQTGKSEHTTVTAARPAPLSSVSFAAETIKSEESSVEQRANDQQSAQAAAQRRPGRFTKKPASEHVTGALSSSSGSVSLFDRSSSVTA